MHEQSLPFQFLMTLHLVKKIKLEINFIWKIGKHELPHSLVWSASWHFLRAHCLPSCVYCYSFLSNPCDHSRSGHFDHCQYCCCDLNSSWRSLIVLFNSCSLRFINKIILKKNNNNKFFILFLIELSKAHKGLKSLR